MPRYNVMFDVAATASIQVDAPDEEEARLAAWDVMNDGDYEIHNIIPEGIFDVEEIEE